MTGFIYPPTPENVPASVTNPSAAFKKEVSGVMGSIVFFFIVYILLLLLSVVLVVGCFYAGIYIIANMPKLITIVAGLGLMGVGVMIFIFLIKFIFSVSKYDRSGIVEITETEQPALFAFIRQLTNDTQTKFPKKIYISPDVNACVFYDSSFWSMFFPVKKNLQIGLGLVNAVNISEFKAVMAHEFGHFSQRSMKLGSFVYNVNKIIYNMLFDNKGYASFLQSWANIDGIFALFASITAGIAQGIQSILRGMYGIINKKYMSLSREMEFHADAVAASVSGSESLCTSLRRIEMAASGYDITLGKCDELFREKKISTNIYPHFSSIMLHLADEYKLPVKNGLPQVSQEFVNSMNNSRINFKDQWASHPSTEDRVKHLQELAIPAAVWEQSAWELFENREALQQQLTSKIYAQAETTDTHSISSQEFEERLNKDIVKNTFPSYYNGFFDNRQIDIPADDAQENLSAATDASLLFTPENAVLTKRINAVANDIEILKAISEKRIDVKSFDFDGTKYERKHTEEITAKLEEELKLLKEKQAEGDKSVINFFLAKAKQKSENDYTHLKSAYDEYFDLRRKANNYLNNMETMLAPLQQIFAGQSLPMEQINVMIDQLRDVDQEVFKKGLQRWSEKGAFAANAILDEKVNKFIASKYIYFEENRFRERELSTLHELCNESWGAVNNFLFEKFKAILEQQLQFVNQ